MIAPKIRPSSMCPPYCIDDQRSHHDGPRCGGPYPETGSVLPQTHADDYEGEQPQTDTSSNIDYGHAGICTGAMVNSMPHAYGILTVGAGMPRTFRDRLSSRSRRAIARVFMSALPMVVRDFSNPGLSRQGGTVAP